MPVATDVLDWKIFLVGVGVLALTLITNIIIPFLPVSGFTFSVFSVLFWFASLCITFFYLHKLLQRKEPLTFIKPIPPLKKRRGEIKPNQHKLQGFTNDINNYFINKWYIFISKDSAFTEETRLFLEDVTKRIAEIQFCVNNKALTQGILNIYLRHLKEYRRSLKRKDKYNGSFEEMYRYSHIVSTNPKVKNYFLHQLTTNTMKHFINSELWNSLPCHVLISILARKLILYILNFVSNPEVLNYHLLNSLASKEIREKYNLNSYSRICVNQYYDEVDSKDIKEKELPIEQKIKRTISPTVQVEENIKIEQNTNNENESIKRKNNVSQGTQNKSDKVKKIDNAEEVKEVQQIQTVKSTASAPVKIYEPKLTRSTKTYADTKDLAFGISLGQDPLDVLPMRMENVKSKMEHVEDSASLLFSEVKQTTQSTMEGLKSSIKPISDATVHTLHNFKDLQETTVNNALHRIGDFQDEAAGMVEGILDFGRAGFRKGLRLTGLQDNIEQAKASLNISQFNKLAPKTKVNKTYRSYSTDKSVEEESVWMNPLQMESPNYDGQILLETSLENPDRKKRDMEIPSISMEEPSSGTNTPDVEYEETADLASSIAKLRSLLQQRSSESSLSTPALSPILVQTKGHPMI